MFSKKPKSPETTEQKMEQVEMGITEAKDQVVLAIDKTIDRGENLEELDIKAENLKDGAKIFHKQARKTRWEMWKEKCKANMLLLIVTAIIIVIVVVIIAAIV